MSTPLQTFKSNFLQLNPELSVEAWDYIADHSQLFTAPAKSIIIEENKVQIHIFFMTSGLVRGFYINDKGEEISIRFINHTGWITHYSALITYSPSTYIFQTLEKSEIFALPFSLVQEGYTKYKGLEKFGRLIAENVLKTQQKRIESFQFMTAEERYLDFIKSHPDIFNRVSLSHLSTFLGIKRQSLTRIRQKLANQKF